ncbi:MAG: hypothetical protein LBC23_02420 [Coriobacteriales bacterium]|jgi:hypothetical protein|nr:hypothetical protein [Coriobacteriales bacterium]
MGTRKAMVTPPHRTAVTRALFLELTLDLVIFAICAVICLQVFGAARVESTRSAALSQLGIEAQERAELFKAQGGQTSALADLPGAHQEDGALVWYYDQNLLPVSGVGEGSAVEGADGGNRPYFTLRCDFIAEQDDPVQKARITLLEGSTPATATTILEYQVSAYQLGTGVDG